MAGGVAAPPGAAGQEYLQVAWTAPTIALASVGLAAPAGATKASAPHPLPPMQAWSVTLPRIRSSPPTKWELARVVASQAVVRPFQVAAMESAVDAGSGLWLPNASNP